MVDAAPRRAYIATMTILLTILVVVFALAALGALVRGIVMFLRQSGEEARAGLGPSASSVKQNKMMWRRIQFQAAAVAAAVLLLMLAHPHG